MRFFYDPLLLSQFEAIVERPVARTYTLRCKKRIFNIRPPPDAIYTNNPLIGKPRNPHPMPVPISPRYNNDHQGCNELTYEMQNGKQHDLSDSKPGSNCENDNGNGNLANKIRAVKWSDPVFKASCSGGVEKGHLKVTDEMQNEKRLDLFNSKPRSNSQDNKGHSKLVNKKRAVKWSEHVFNKSSFPDGVQKAYDNIFYEAANIKWSDLIDLRSNRKNRKIKLTRDMSSEIRKIMSDIIDRNSTWILKNSFTFEDVETPKLQITKAIFMLTTVSFNYISEIRGVRMNEDGTEVDESDLQSLKIEM